ncbi:uncharacterized protein EV422DRAFT_580765 [Fimicolochytrium jonesii]|uniref:uncharacterized protein n=1 Tax=Fimicolochytrium jonesii TaxID=1396493 RepID=UPI0022FECE5E|nr:uncharacterized protein EV422DRAFT_580765 [Fimicolochytrium jonesii]KAI8817427.1 hypothetical protein EV422DRAFT_580765 [Fimicolochytrium jonesii]
MADTLPDSTSLTALPAFPSSPLQTLPLEVLAHLIAYLDDLEPLRLAYLPARSLIDASPSVRGRWLITKFGRAFVLFHPRVAQLPARVFDAQTVEALMNLGAGYQYTPLFGKDGSDGRLLPIQALQALAVAATSKMEDGNMELRDLDRDPDGGPPFDIWMWAVQTAKSPSLIHRLVRSGADVNYMDSFAVTHAAKARDAAMLSKLVLELGAKIPVVGKTPYRRDSSLRRSAAAVHPFAPFVNELVAWYRAGGLVRVVDQCNEEYIMIMEARARASEREAGMMNDGDVVSATAVDSNSNEDTFLVPLPTFEERPPLSPPLIQHQKSFWHRIGRHNRFDVLRHASKRALQSSSPSPSTSPWHITHSSACSIFLGAATAGHLPLLTEMVLTHAVPIDHGSSLALSNAVRLMRSDMLHACLALGATVPRTSAVQLAAELVGWASTPAILAFLQRAEMGGAKGVMTSHEFLTAVGRCGRADVVEVLVREAREEVLVRYADFEAAVRRRRGVVAVAAEGDGYAVSPTSAASQYTRGSPHRPRLNLTPRHATTLLLGASAGGHLEFIRDLVDIHGAHPVGGKAFAAVMEACRSVKAAAPDVVEFLLCRWVATRDLDSEGACTTDEDDDSTPSNNNNATPHDQHPLQTCLLESTRFAGLDKPALISTLLTYLPPAGFIPVSAVATLEALKSWQWDVARHLSAHVLAMLVAGDMGDGVVVLLTTAGYAGGCIATAVKQQKQQQMQTPPVLIYIPATAPTLVLATHLVHLRRRHEYAAYVVSASSTASRAFESAMAVYKVGLGGNVDVGISGRR